MADIYRISFVKLLRALAEQARNDFADKVFDAESTGERPDLEPVVVEIAVEFAEDISDAIEALQARVLEHDRIVAEKDAEIARLGRKEEMMSDLKARLLAGTQVPLFDLRIEAAGEIESLEAERDRWHADATLMLGFADLAYAAGAAPASSELIAARDRALAAIRNAALEDAAQMLLRKFRSMGLIEDFAAAIRAMKGE